MPKRFQSKLWTKNSKRMPRPQESSKVDITFTPIVAVDHGPGICGPGSCQCPDRAPKARPVYLNLTDDQGTLLLRLDLSEYDLSKPIAQMELLGEIRREVKLAQER